MEIEACKLSQSNNFTKPDVHCKLRLNLIRVNNVLQQAFGNDHFVLMYIPMFLYSYAVV